MIAAPGAAAGVPEVGGELVAACAGLARAADAMGTEAAMPKRAERREICTSLHLLIDATAGPVRDGTRCPRGKRTVAREHDGTPIG
jgi:hypothetical protein